MCVWSLLISGTACTHMSCSEKEITHSSLRIRGKGLRAGWAALYQWLFLLKIHGQAVNANLSLLIVTLHSYFAQVCFMWGSLLIFAVVTLWHCSLFGTAWHMNLCPALFLTRGETGRLVQLKLAYRNYVYLHHGPTGVEYFPFYFCA